MDTVVLQDGNTSNKNLSRREEKAQAKHFGNDQADRTVSEQQQADSGKQSATVAVKTEQLKAGSSSNAGVVRGLDSRRSNLQGNLLLNNQANPPPTYWDVTKKIFKEVVDTAYGCCCSSSTSTLDIDKFLNEAPFPTKNQAMATLWSDISD